MVKLSAVMFDMIHTDQHQLPSRVYWQLKYGEKQLFSKYEVISTLCKYGGDMPDNAVISQ